jgi:signal transduction histidine kinase
LKFTKEGSVKIIVEIIQENQEKYLKISVKDTGVGIQEHDLDKLFKLFGFL